MANLHRHRVIGIRILWYVIGITNAFTPKNNVSVSNNSSDLSVSTSNESALSLHLETNNDFTEVVADMKFDTQNRDMTFDPDDEISSGDDIFPFFDDEDCNANTTHTNVATLESASHRNYTEESSTYDHTVVGFIPCTVYLICIYFILIVGLVGNVIVFILMKLRFSTLSYSIYIRFLAVMDSLVLIKVCVDDIADHQFDNLQGFLTFKPGFCQVWDYVYNVARLASPWFVALFTLDRFIVVIYPLKRMYFCTVKIAFIISFILLFVCIFESFIFIIHKREECELIVWNLFLYWYLAVARILIKSGLPCIIIFFLNVCIVCGIKRSVSFRNKFTGPQTSTRTKSRIRGEHSVTVSLMAVSLMAFCTLAPISVCELIESTRYDIHDGEGTIPSYIEDVASTWPMLNLISLLNFGLNGYIMMATSANYRQEFLTLLGFRQFTRGYQVEARSFTGPPLSSIIK